MRRARIIFVITALVGFFASLSAEPVAQLHPSNYVNDFARVLSGDTETQLNDICKQVDEKAHAQIAVVTVNSLDGRDVEGYAVDLFKQWGVGSKKTDHGVLILVAVQDHRDRIEVGYGLEPILPDGKAGDFMREAVPSFKQNDYDGGIRLMTLRVADVIATDAGIQLTGAEAPATPVAEPQSGLSPTGIILLIIAGIIVLATPPLRKILFWWLIFGGGSRGGGWGGGGFGGGGGGGGFGGFGGGSSGGGGASGSW